MTWIDTRTLPLKEGKYNCLISYDDWQNLREVKDEYFDGNDWCHYNSHRQFIRYWQASKEDYEIICERHEIDYEKYLDEQAQHAKNFGGI